MKERAALAAVEARGQLCIAAVVEVRVWRRLTCRLKHYGWRSELSSLRLHCRDNLREREEGCRAVPQGVVCTESSSSQLEPAWLGAKSGDAHSCAESNDLPIVVVEYRALLWDSYRLSAQIPCWLIRSTIATEPHMEIYFFWQNQAVELYWSRMCTSTVLLEAICFSFHSTQCKIWGLKRSSS
jgi:hypothetical protein